MRYITINGKKLKSVDYSEIKKQVQEFVPKPFSFGVELVVADYIILNLFFKKGQSNEFSTFINEILKHRKHLCEYDNYSGEFFLHQRYFEKIFNHDISKNGITVRLISANPTCVKKC